VTSNTLVCTMLIQLGSVNQDAAVCKIYLNISLDGVASRRWKLWGTEGRVRCRSRATGWPRMPKRSAKAA